MCFDYHRIHSSTYKTAYTDACKTHHTVSAHKNRLPEDEPSVSKHGEDINKLKN